MSALVFQRHRVCHFWLRYITPLYSYCIIILTASRRVSWKFLRVFLSTAFEIFESLIVRYKMECTGELKIVRSEFHTNMSAAAEDGTCTCLARHAREVGIHDCGGWDQWRERVKHSTTRSERWPSKPSVIASITGDHDLGPTLTFSMRFITIISVPLAFTIVALCHFVNFLPMLMACSEASNVAAKNKFNKIFFFVFLPSIWKLDKTRARLDSYDSKYIYAIWVEIGVWSRQA